MKRLVLGSAAVLLLLAVRVDAENACRDFRKAFEYKQHNLSSVVAVDPSVFASVTFEDASPTSTFAIKGTFCDSALQPLADRNLRVIQVERSPEAGPDPLPADALTTGLAEEIQSRDVVTSESGKFLVSGLAPGEYVFEVDWEGLGAYVVLDLRHIPGPPLRSAVEQIGLLRP